MRFQRYTVPTYALFRLVRQKFIEVRVLQTAGALTYTTLLSLVPMITVVLMIMRQFSPFMKLGEGMRGFLLHNLLPESAGKVVATYALQFSEKASSLTVVGAAFLLVTAVMLFSTIDRTLNSIWVVRRPRPWYVRIPVYWLALTLGPLILAASIAATGEVVRASLGSVDPPGWLRNHVDRGATAILLSALFAFMFHVIPNRRLNVRHAIIGGVVAGIGVVLAQRLFGFYLTKLPNFTLIYGTFSVLPIFLIWLYLTWVVFLLGATLAAVLPDFTARHRLLPATPSAFIVATLRLAMTLAEAQQRGQSLDAVTLAAACRQTPAQALQMLEDMRLAGWVVRCDDGNWILSVAADRLMLGDLVARIVIGLGKAETHAQGLTEADRRLLDIAVGPVQAALARPITSLVQIG